MNFAVCRSKLLLATRPKQKNRKQELAPAEKFHDQAVSFSISLAVPGGKRQLSSSDLLAFPAARFILVGL